MKFALFSGSAPEWTPARLIERLAAQGWDGVEWRIANQPPADVPAFFAGNLAVYPETGIEGRIGEINRITRAAGLGQAGISGNAAMADHEAVVRTLSATAALGARQIRVTVPKTQAGISYEVQFAETRKHAIHAAEQALRLGVKALIQIHHGNIVSSASAARRMVEGLDPDGIGVIHDLGNMTIEGREGLGTYTPGMEILGPYMALVHIKNVVWTPSPPKPDGTVDWAWKWAPLATGLGDVASYFRSLREVNYDGWVVVENFTLDLPLEERLAGDLAYLKAAARAAGYSV